MRRSLLVPATTVRGLPSDEVGDGDSLSNPEDASSGNMRLEVRGDGRPFPSMAMNVGAGESSCAVFGTDLASDGKAASAALVGVVGDGGSDTECPLGVVVFEPRKEWSDT